MAEWRRTGWTSVYHYGEGRQCRLSYRLIEDGLKYEDFPDVSQPTLIFHGTGDTVVPVSLSGQFVRGRKQARLVRLDSGHELTDQMDGMWRDTAAFLGC